MTFTAETLPATKTIIDQSAHTITFERTFSAPRESIFEAWTQPEHIASWWDPSGIALAECEMDLRPGGSFKFLNPGWPYPFSGTYREIIPPCELVFDAIGAVGRVVLTDDNGKTKMTLIITCSSLEHLNEFVKLGIDVGTAKTLDNLVLYIPTMKR